jgi:sterol desaturase/sphingolipid hydroxylase (fatty acid hydroxylase superfamily)
MLIFVTLSILTCSIALAGVYSYLVLNKKLGAGGRIQDLVYKQGVFKKHFPLIAFNLATLYVFSAGGLYFAASAFDMQLPTWYLFLGQVLIMLVFDDTYFYFFHRFMHENTYIFGKIHSIHHKARPPFPLDFIYVHPLEWMLGSTGMSGGMLLIFWLFGDINVYAFWFFAAFRNLHEIEIHSGIKSIVGQYIPFYGTTEHHDYHHSKLTGNYSSSLTVWDKIFKTNITPRS